MTYNFLANTCRWYFYQRTAVSLRAVAASLVSYALSDLGWLVIPWGCCAGGWVCGCVCVGGGGWVRESADHGPFNSWDRQVYVTDVRTGQPDVIKEWDDISHNFIIANYNSQEAIDNDDGSWWVWRCTSLHPG
jgi:hypothetical protein